MEENENTINEEKSNIEEKEQKKIKVVAGDGDLTISPVYDHLEVEKPRPKENREIVVPEVKDNVSREENNSINGSEQNDEEVPYSEEN